MMSLSRRCRSSLVRSERTPRVTVERSVSTAAVGACGVGTDTVRLPRWGGNEFTTILWSGPPPVSMPPPRSAHTAQSRSGAPKIETARSAAAPQWRGPEPTPRYLGSGRRGKGGDQTSSARPPRTGVDSGDQVVGAREWQQQVETECGPLALHRRDGELGPHRLDQLAADRQSEPRAAEGVVAGLLTAAKRLEQ